METTKIQFQRGDVELVDLDPPVCHECDEPAAYAIQIDLRGCGMTQLFGNYCKPCGKSLVDRIRATLPDDTEDGTVPS